MKYIETRTKLVERKEEIMRNIVEHSRQEKDVIIKLKEAEETEKLTNMGIR